MSGCHGVAPAPLLATAAPQGGTQAGAALSRYAEGAVQRRLHHRRRAPPAWHRGGRDCDDRPRKNHQVFLPLEKPPLKNHQKNHYYNNKMGKKINRRGGGAAQAKMAIEQRASDVAKVKQRLK